MHTDVEAWCQRAWFVASVRQLCMGMDNYNRPPIVPLTSRAPIRMTITT